MHQAHQPAAAMKQPPAVAPVQYPKWFGGSASCMAVVLTHPLDLSELF